MLPRKKTVNLKKEFPKIRQTGKNYDSPSFGLLVSYNNSNKTTQVAFIISKKVDKKSVVRHEVKRKLSDAIAFFLPHLANNLELVFLAKQKAVQSDRDQLKTEIETVLRRARLIAD
ncbi:ribonuclease P protein component [Patescibacteria group bacterium]|nr:ribonuclease P protein component [Patescibacteria group bacterium]